MTAAFLRNSRFVLSARRLSFCIVFAAALTLIGVAPGVMSAVAADLTLWYSKPATEWVEALPVGNGRMGAMIFGGITNERVQLNEQTIWAGQPLPMSKPNGPEKLARARKLFFEGKYAEGEKVIQDEFLGPRDGARSYQPLGDLMLTFDHSAPVSDYRRELNLDTAIATATYVSGGVTYTREVFASGAADVIVVRLSASQPGKISFSATLERPDAELLADGANTLVVRGQAHHTNKFRGTKFEGRVRTINEKGTATLEGRTLRVQNADAVTLLIGAATDYNHAEPLKPHNIDLTRACEALVQKVSSDYSAVRRDSIAAHQKLFRRVALDLGPGSSKPTNERIDAVKRGEPDHALAALYFQFGRYLLIGSSRPGGLPANLQGLWNDRMHAPWNSDYHININIQMNYWPAEVANLSECHDPFFDFVEGLVPAGRETAKELFNARGFLGTHTTDAWRWVKPVGLARWGMWVTGAGWCTQHFMERYRYTGDTNFLRSRAYPILKESSLFFLDWLVEDPKTGKLVSGPATSPENAYITPTGQRAALSMGPSMDQQIIWDVFNNTLEAAAILGIRDEFTAEVQRALSRLAMPKIGSDGRLMEWTEEFKEADAGHRHISHLFALHPGRQYNVVNAPEMVAAARKTIDHRLANGGGHTGWSRAWIINFWARFHDGEKAHENVVALLAKSTLPNLFDTHPPFQIDGNFGGAAGIAEMLLQSHVSENVPGMGEVQLVHILPALPKAWSEGGVSGLRARGGFELDFKWKDGKLAALTLRSKLGRPCKLLAGDKTVQVNTRAGQTLQFTGDLKPQS